MNEVQRTLVIDYARRLWITRLEMSKLHIWTERPWSAWIETTGVTLLRLHEGLVDWGRRTITSKSVFVFDKSKWNKALDSHLSQMLALPRNWHLRARLDLIRTPTRMITRQCQWAPLWMSIDTKKGRWWEVEEQLQVQTWWSDENGEELG